VFEGNLFLEILGPLRILGPLTEKNISRSTQKYQQEKSSDNYENKSLKSHESNPFTKYTPKGTYQTKTYKRNGNFEE
jgi:hypothetical protein